MVENKKLCYRCTHYDFPVKRKKKGYGENIFDSCANCRCFVFWS